MSLQTWFLWATRCRFGHDWTETAIGSQCFRCHKVTEKKLVPNPFGDRDLVGEIYIPPLPDEDIHPLVHGRPHDQRMKDNHEGFDR